MSHAQQLNTFLNAHIATLFTTNHGVLSSHVIVCGGDLVTRWCLINLTFIPSRYTITLFKVCIQLQSGIKRRLVQCKMEGIFGDLSILFQPPQFLSKLTSPSLTPITVLMPGFKTQTLTLCACYVMKNIPKACHIKCRSGCCAGKPAACNRKETNKDIHNFRIR